jgi:adenine-specific DNA-methyltransferase
LLPKDKLRFYQRARALLPRAITPRGATRLTHTVLALWLERKFPRLSRASLVQTKSLRTNPQVIALAEWLAAQKLLDAAFWLSSAYAIWIGDSIRQDRAMFFTPPELSLRLIKDVEQNGADFGRSVFMDPACGGAAFLAPLAIRIRQELKNKGYGPGRVLKHIGAHLVGVDIDPTLCQLSTFFLKMALYADIVATGKEPRFHVHCGNALTDLRRHRGRIDVVLCNPPYRKMPSDEVALYRKQYGDVIEGQPNLYTLFFALGLDLLRPNGTAALLTATTFLSGQYFSKLRTHLLHYAHAKQIDIVGERNGVFIGVELDTAITVFQKSGPKTGRRNKTKVYALGPASRFERIGAYGMPNSGGAWAVPKSSDDAKAIAVANGSEYRLADYGYRTRIGTFVWNRDKRRRFFSERAAKRGAKSKAAFPLIWSSDISQGGRVNFSSGSIRHSFVNMRDVDHVSVVRKPAVVLQRVTSSDQPRRLVGAPISRQILRRYGGVVGENHVVFLEQTKNRPVLSARQFARVLRSKPIDRLFRSISGAANVSAFELSQLPMPKPALLAQKLDQATDVDAAVLRAFRTTDSKKK